MICKYRVLTCVLAFTVIFSGYGKGSADYQSTLKKAYSGSLETLFDMPALIAKQHPKSNATQIDNALLAMTTLKWLEFTRLRVELEKQYVGTQARNDLNSKYKKLESDVRTMFPRGLDYENAQKHIRPYATTLLYKRLPFITFKTNPSAASVKARLKTILDRDKVSVTDRPEGPSSRHYQTTEGVGAYRKTTVKYVTSPNALPFLQRLAHIIGGLKHGVIGSQGIVKRWKAELDAAMTAGEYIYALDLLTNETDKEARASLLRHYALEGHLPCLLVIFYMTSCEARTRKMQVEADLYARLALFRLGQDFKCVKDTMQGAGDLFEYFILMIKDSIPKDSYFHKGMEKTNAEAKDVLKKYVEHIERWSKQPNGTLPDPQYASFWGTPMFDPSGKPFDMMPVDSWDSVRKSYAEEIVMEARSQLKKL